jgi:drug/metabolite transporter (DMT)-like permease
MVQVYVLLFTTPVLISLLAIPFLGEKIHASRGISILMGFIGVIVVLRPSPENLEIGHLFGFAAALCNSSASIISRKIGNVENAAILILSPLLLSIFLSGGTLYFVYTPMPLGDLSLMFLLGVFALLGQLFILTGYRCAPAAVVAPMQYSQILWAILFGWLFFDESVDQVAVIGLVITVFSGVMIVWRETIASVRQPVLHSRNTRSVASGPMPGSESDE